MSLGSRRLVLVRKELSFPDEVLDVQVICVLERFVHFDRFGLRVKQCRISRKDDVGDLGCCLVDRRFGHLGLLLFHGFWFLARGGTHAEAWHLAVWFPGVRVLAVTNHFCSLSVFDFCIHEVKAKVHLLHAFWVRDQLAQLNEVHVLEGASRRQAELKRGLWQNGQSGHQVISFDRIT